MTNYQVHTSPSTPPILMSPGMHPCIAFPSIQEMEFPLAYNSTTKDTGSTPVPVIPFCSVGYDTRGSGVWTPNWLHTKISGPQVTLAVWNQIPFHSWFKFNFSLLLCWVISWVTLSSIKYYLPEISFIPLTRFRFPHITMQFLHWGESRVLIY
jgi:hypothetical protein